MYSIKIKNNFAQQTMIEAGNRLARVFEKINFLFLVGKSTYDVDMFIKQELDALELISLAKGYMGKDSTPYPAYSCISLNNVLVHGIPSRDIIIQETDLIKVDICIRYKEYCADMARMYGDFDSIAAFRKIFLCAQKSLDNAIQVAVPGNTLGDIGYIIEKTVVNEGYFVADTFCGHGIGKHLHELPEVHNTGCCGEGLRLKDGMALAIEPMFCEQSPEVVILDDGWTACSFMGGLTAHIEDTVIIKNDIPIVTTRL
jgi:methionyl aminopeptidase